MVYWRTTPVGARRRHAVSRRWPKVEYKEEGMRDGIQIEDAAISVDDKVRLLEALSDAGLKHIVVGSFVRPEYTPQMDHIEEILERFQPRPGVKYTALLVNERAVERARQFAPPLTIEEREPMLAAHLCDVFPRRNYNRSRQQELDGWPRTVARAKERGPAQGVSESTRRGARTSPASTPSPKRWRHWSEAMPCGMRRKSPSFRCTWATP